MTGKQRAQKRTKKTRSSLAAQLGEGAGERAARIKLGVAGLPAVRSKSAQRRQKQREREQLAGNQAGLRDLHDAVDQVESDHMQAPRAPLPSTLTKKVQRAVLARERQRQPYILSDLHQSAQPFAALRTHARNTLSMRRKPNAKDELK